MTESLGQKDRNCSILVNKCTHGERSPSRTVLLRVSSEDSQLPHVFFPQWSRSDSKMLQNLKIKKNSFLPYPFLATVL